MAQSHNSINRKSCTTILLGVEGNDEEAVSKHLKGMFHHGAISTIKIKDTLGGSPKMAVEKTIRLANDGDYNLVYVWVDSDREELDEAKELAKKNGIILLCSEPLCLEGLLLKICGHKKIPNTSDACKSQLKRFFKEKLLSQILLESHFSKANL
jgi:hypothetical protein